MKRVLGLALYGPLAASTRYRLEQYTSGLLDHGIDLRLQYLLGDEYLKSRFAGSRVSVPSLAYATLSRLKRLAGMRNFDAAILYCELVPMLPGFAEIGLLRKPYVYDFDDAFYLRYRTGRLRFARPLLGGKFDSLLRGAAAVTAGSRALFNYAERHNGNTHLLPTVVDTTRYTPKPGLRGRGTFTVGWIGSPSTAAAYLGQLAGPLSVLGAEGKLRFVVVGGRSPAIPNVEVQEFAWSEESEIDLINSFDLGVMPLVDDEWSRGKCAFKLIQYMACGVPVVASPVGANIDVVADGCGLLASSPDEWIQALRELRDDPGRREMMGAAGRERVENIYSLGVALPKLATILLQATRAQ